MTENLVKKYGTLLVNDFISDQAAQRVYCGLAGG
jgi:hypothetical protein